MHFCALYFTEFKSYVSHLPLILPFTTSKIIFFRKFTTHLFFLHLFEYIRLIVFIISLFSLSLWWLKLGPKVLGKRMAPSEIHSIKKSNNSDEDLNRVLFDEIHLKENMLLRYIYIYMYIYVCVCVCVEAAVFWFGFYGISTFVGYLMPNLF